MPCLHCQRTDHKELEGLTYDSEVMLRPCWLYANDPRYKASWDGLPVPEIESPPITIPSKPPIDVECVKNKQRESAGGRILKGPSLAQKAVNFTKAVVQHVAAGLPQSSDDLVLQRKAICEGCDLYNKTTEECTHRSCGCQMPVKWRWKDQTCPLQKW